MTTTKQNPSTESSKSGQHGQSSQSAGFQSTQGGSKEQIHEKQGSKDSMGDQKSKSGVRDMDPSSKRSETPDRPDNQHNPGRPDRPDGEDNPNQITSRTGSEPKDQGREKDQDKNKVSKNLTSDEDEKWLEIDPEVNRKTPSSVV